jgi:hypothetical protein
MPGRDSTHLNSSALAILSALEERLIMRFTPRSFQSATLEALVSRRYVGVVRHRQVMP